MNLRAQLLAVTEAYCLATKRSSARVSTLIFNDGKRIAAIKEGGDLGTIPLEAAMQWFADHWPKGDQTWPAGVPRPVKSTQPEAAQ